MSNNSSQVEPDPIELWETTRTLDKASVCICLITGIPGNIFIFVTMRSLQTSVATFHYQLLAVFDGISLLLQLSLRPIDWYEMAVDNSRSVHIGWSIYFNVAYFTGIYANWVLVYIAMERLIALRYPSQVQIYLTVPRAKLNAVITAFLIYSFAIIVIIKMKYFGISWLVVFTTFYTAFPLAIVFIIIWLLLGTMGEQRRLKKKAKREAQKHQHHHDRNDHSHKSGTTSTTSQTPSTVQTPTGSSARSPTEARIPTLTKSTSGLSRHSGHKHDTMSLGGHSLATRNSNSTAVKEHPQPRGNTALHAFINSPTFSFTDNPRRPVRVPTPEPEELLPPELMSQKAKEKKDLERCYTCMMLATSIAFVLLTIPYTVVQYIYVTDEREITDIFNEHQAKMKFLIMIALSMMYVEHSCNFYIFFLFSWRFRKQVIRVITRKTATPPETETAKESEQTKTMV